MELCTGGMCTKERAAKLQHHHTEVDEKPFNNGEKRYSIKHMSKKKINTLLSELPS